MSALRDALADLPDAVFADLLESDDAYLLIVDVPGATAETTDLTVEDGRLHVTALRKSDVPTGFEYRREGRDETLTFDLLVPPDAESTRATASLERGVLEIELPRRSTGGTEITVE